MSDFAIKYSPTRGARKRKKAKASKLGGLGSCSARQLERHAAATHSPKRRRRWLQYASVLYARDGRLDDASRCKRASEIMGV